jgi:hypothetical protein
MSLFILWRDTTSELWTPVQFPLHCYHLFTLLALFTFSHTTIAFHSIRSFLCLQQTGEIDNFIVSWEQSSWLCCVQVPRCCWRSKALDEAPYKLSRAVAKLAGITFWSLAFSWTDKPWFLTEGKTCWCAHHTFLLEFPTGRWFTSSTPCHISLYFSWGRWLDWIPRLMLWFLEWILHFLACVARMLLLSFWVHQIITAVAWQDLL